MLSLIHHQKKGKRNKLDAFINMFIAHCYPQPPLLCTSEYSEIRPIPATKWVKQQEAIALHLLPEWKAHNHHHIFFTHGQMQLCRAHDKQVSHVCIWSFWIINLTNAKCEIAEIWAPPKKIKRLVVFFCKKSDGKKYKLRYSRFSWPSIHCNKFFIQSLNPLFLFLCVFSRPHESGPVRVFRFRGHPQVQSGPVLRHRGRLHHLPPAHPPPRYPPH